MKYSRLMLALLATLVVTGSAAAQKRGSDPAHKLDLTWDRWLDHQEIGERMALLAKTWPKFLKFTSIGKSYGGREIWMMVVNNPETGPDTAKAAMYIEANVHGNEIQGAEVSLYTIWYLMENYDSNPNVKRLVDQRAFYIVPTINPDGRDYFLYGTGYGSRTGHVPVDDDGDGKVDEDGPDDLNGDGMISQIRKYVPGEGNYRLSKTNPRYLEPVGFGEKGDYIMLGSEGIDNDGDGLVDEDPPGGYDPNRNYGTDWQPEYIQGGAMNYPFELPESRASNEFWSTHPNIAGFQTFHNSGGMILRGPGAAWQGTYPSDDSRVYDELGHTGERMLPYYDYLVIWSGLYTVHGGSLDWTNDGLGVVSFSNELWADPQYFGSPKLQQQQQQPNSEISWQNGDKFFNDFLEFSAGQDDWKPFNHPIYGKVELSGGWGKLYGRVNPRFMSMELFHRNMAFTLYHADQMPIMSIGKTTVERVQDSLFRVRVELTNDRVIPTILTRAAEHKVVRPDLLTVEGKVDVIVAGWGNNIHDPDPMTLIDQHDLKRIMIRNGHPGKTTRTIEYLVRGSGPMTIQYSSLKGGTVKTTVQLK